MDYILTIKASLGTNIDDLQANTETHVKRLNEETDRMKMRFNETINMTSDKTTDKNLRYLRILQDTKDDGLVLPPVPKSGDMMNNTDMKMDSCKPNKTNNYCDYTF